MKWLDGFANCIKKINTGIAFVGMFLLIPLMLMMTGDVIGRVLFNSPIKGSYELASYLLACFVLLGIAYTYQVGGHVRIDLLVTRLPKRAAYICEIISILLSLFIVAILVWQGWLLGISDTAVSEQLRIPEGPFRLLVPFAATMLWLVLLAELIEKIYGLFRRS